MTSDETRPDREPHRPSGADALVAAGAAGVRLAQAWCAFLAALDVLEAANREEARDA